MAKRNKKFFVAVLGILLILVIVLSLKFCVIYNPIPFQEAQFIELANWVEMHHPSNAHTVVLPQRYARFSMTGKVYVTDNDIFIPTWIGRRTLLPNWFSSDKDCEGYLFVKNELTYDKPAGDMDQVTIYIPNFSGLHGLNSPKGVLKSVMFIRSKMNPKWYALESPSRSVLE